jgi:hypothetical protein
MWLEKKKALKKISRSKVAIVLWLIQFPTKVVWDATIVVPIVPLVLLKPKTMNTGLTQPYATTVKAITQNLSV